MTPDRTTLLEMYRRMVRIRQFELAATDIFKRGQLKGTVHTYIGMEASGVGVCMALRQDDLIAGTHRSHGHNIAKGADLRRMMAELLGKETGYCKGRGGSMHIAAFETGSLGALAVVGSGIPLAVGAGLAFQMRGEARVAVPFTGDAGSNTGNWHELMNMAAAWGLPVVFVLENNHFGVSTRIEDVVKEPDLSRRAAGYGMPGVRVDGFDVLAVYEAATDGHRAGALGPGPDAAGHRELPGRWPLRRRARGLPRQGRGGRVPGQGSDRALPCPPHRRRAWSTAAELDAVDAEVAALIEESIAFAKASPEPDPATALDYIYA